MWIDMKFAVIETGGKQYKVLPGTKLKIEKLNGAAGEEIVFDKVLLVSDGSEVSVGEPYLKNAAVSAKVLNQGRGDKKVVFRFHSKTRYRKNKSHRQQFTEIIVEEIRT